MQPTATPISWKRNLAVLWVAQVATTLAFSFTIPFYPIFFEELGVTDVERAAFLAGISGWFMGLAMGLFAPIWGMVGDRFGRRRNIMRALVLGGTFLVISGYSQNSGQLMISRFFIGAGSGVVPTIMAMVATHTPRERIAFATGATQSALFLGIALGPLLGGIIYDNYGMRASFWATGGVMFLAAALVLAFVREEFTKPTTSIKSPFEPFVDLWRLASSRAFWPLMLMVTLAMSGHMIPSPAVPGIVKNIEGGTESATVVGVVLMISGFAAAVSSLLLGWLSGRIGARTVFIWAAGLGAVGSVGPYFAPNLIWFALSAAAVGLVSGGVSALLAGFVALRAPQGKLGVAFGASQTAHAVGVAFAPLIGGLVAVTLGLRSTFLAGGVGLAMLFVLAVLYLAPRTPAPAQQTTEETTS